MDHHDHDLGLTHDLRLISRQLAERRRLLRWMMGGSAALLLGACDGEDLAADSGGTGTGGGSGAGSGSSCVAHPEETNGPFPSDGSNTANGSLSNVLLQSGVVRSDIRGSFGTSGNTAPGVPLQLEITLASSGGSCAPLADWAVYIWHCTRDGAYSLYNSGVQNENFLRGVQVSDANGKLSFTTIFPGCYPGRYPHIHFEVYRSLASATGFGNRVLCSQLALPRNVCSAVYSGAAGYGASVNNLAGVSIASDGIFGNNTDAQIAAQTATLSGSVDTGFTGSVVVGVAA